MKFCYKYYISLSLSLFFFFFFFFFHVTSAQRANVHLRVRVRVRAFVRSFFLSSLTLQGTPSESGAGSTSTAASSSTTAATSSSPSYGKPDLLSLPTKVWETIFQYLAPYELGTLATVSRRAYRAAHRIVLPGPPIELSYKKVKLEKLGILVEKWAALDFVRTCTYTGESSFMTRASHHLHYAFLHFPM